MCSRVPGGASRFRAVGSLADSLTPLLPALAVAALGAAVLVAMRRLGRANVRGMRSRFLRQVWSAAIGTLAFLGVLLVLPLDGERRGQILSLVGVVLSGTLALSATTFVGNALAGLLLRTVRSFEVGDFVRIEGQFGRVSEKGLFHTEIQTEDRDLTTLPNLFLVTHPLTVVRSSGTIVAATVSLGYDVPRADVERALLAAAADAGLEHPFVQVLELGDFSVLYRVAGLLTDLERLLRARSALRAATIDALHGAGIEIVSPTFMSTRALDPARAILPRARRHARPEPESEAPESIVFDKAEKAKELAELRRDRDQRAADLAGLEGDEAASERERLSRELEALDARITRAEAEAPAA